MKLVSIWNLTGKKNSFIILFGHRLAKNITNFVVSGT